jgi:hypothetical protein
MKEDIADFLNVGDALVLRVAKDPNPKTGKIGFEPMFCGLDQNVRAEFPPNFDYEDPDAYWEENMGSVRFFNPTNFGFELKPGEDWNARVEKVRILPRSKRTADGRRYAFVDVCVLDRKENIEHEFADILNLWITRVRSGNATVSLKREPAERVVREFRASVPARDLRYLIERFFGERRDVVLAMEEIHVDGKVVRQKVTEGVLRETFERARNAKIGDIRHPLGGSLDPKTYKKLVSAIPAYENLPTLPADVEIPTNIRIY